MKLGLVVAAGVLALMGMQATVAANLDREQNRQILIAMEGVDYDPSAPTRVVTGPPHALTIVTVPASQAIEMHLDQLQEHGNKLVDLLTQPPASSEPDWPLVGYIQFHEKGWYQMGARCPDVEPEQEQTIEDLFDTVLPGADDRLGMLTTDVSQYPVNERNSTVQSALQYWNPDQDPTTAPPANTWWYTGWTMDAGFLIDYFCREPAATSGLVFHDSFVTPYADRPTTTNIG